MLFEAIVLCVCAVLVFGAERVASGVRRSRNEFDRDVVSRDASGFLVYSDGRLVTKKPVSRSDAHRLMLDAVAANPEARVQVLGVHEVTRQSQRALVR